MGGLKILTTSVSDCRLLPLNETPFLNDYHKASGLLVRAGLEHIVFAEPAFKGRQQEEINSITWYGLNSDSPVERTNASSTMDEVSCHRLMQAFEALERGKLPPKEAHFLGRCLISPSVGDLYFQDKILILTRWSMSGKDETETQALTRILDEIDNQGRLSRHPRWLDVPPDEEPELETYTPFNKGAPTVGSLASQSEPSPAREEMPQRFWSSIPLLPYYCAGGLLLLLLLLFLGIWIGRDFPGPSSPNANHLADLSTFRQENRAALLAHLAELKRAHEEFICYAEALPAAPLVEGDRSQARLAPSTEGSPSSGARRRSEANEENEAEAAQPETEPATEEAPPSQNSVSFEELERSVFMVIAPGDGRNHSAHGTGFLIAPEWVVTNAHVVEHAKNDEVLVIVGAEDRAVPGKVKWRSPSLEQNNQDYALIKLNASLTDIQPLTFSKSLQKTSRVSALGFPGAYLDSDEAFSAMAESGDASASPSLTVTQGIVNNLHPKDRGATWVYHDAGLLPGNSGGPLLNSCGEVVAINTLVRNLEDVSTLLNVSLGAKDLIAFIEGKQISVQKSDQPCLDGQP